MGLDLSPYALTAERYAGRGWSPIALPRGQKHPPPVGYTGYDGRWVALEDVRRLKSVWEAEGRENVALRLPDGVVGIDVDDYDSKHGAGELAEMEKRLGGLPPTWRSTSRGEGGSGIALYRTGPGIWWHDVTEAGIDLIHMGHRYVVVAPSVHPKTGNRYWWYSPEGVVTVAPHAPSVEQLPWLPDAWVAELQKGWLRDRGSVTRVSRDAVSGWLADWGGAGEEQPCREMAEFMLVCKRKLAVEGASRHDECRNLMLRGLGLGAEGHQGLGAALDALREAMEDAVAGDRRDGELDAEWGRMVSGGVDRVVGALGADAVVVEREPDPCDPATEFGIAWDVGPDGKEDLIGDVSGLVDGAGSAGSGGGDRVTARPDLYFTPKGKLLPHATARGVEGYVPVGLDVRERRLMAYSGGLWRDGEALVAGMLTEMLGEQWTPAGRGAVMDLMRERPGGARIDRGAIPHPDWINTRSGMVNVRTGEVRVGGPEWCSTVQLTVRYVGEEELRRREDRAGGLEVVRWLREVLPEDLVGDRVGDGFIWELMGYLIMNGNPKHLMIYLYGPGGRNGKGTLLRVIEALLGRENYTAVDLGALAEDKFRAAELYGKVANLAGDVDPHWLEKTAILKKITGGDAVDADRKYGQPFTFTPWAVPVFSGNDLFGSADTSDGWLTRWLIVKFPRSFAGREDEGLSDRLCAERSLEEILVGCVLGARRLLERGRFEDGLESLVGAREEFAQAGDLVRQWVSEECVLESGARVNQAVLWRGFMDWDLRREDRGAGRGRGGGLGRNKFYRRLEQMRGVTRGNSNGVKWCQGLRYVGGEGCS